MSSVLRIALTYFDMLGPVQRWINFLGLLFLLATGALIAQGKVPGAVDDIFNLCTAGVTMILIMPLFTAGAALRIASRPSIVHLRPHGRLRVLLGTTLALALLTLLAALPSLATYGFLTVHDLGPDERFPLPGAAFPFMWMGVVVVFIYLFAMSRTLLGAMTFWLLPLMFPIVGKSVDPRLTFVSPALMLAIGVGGWIAFAVWYLRAATISPPASNYFGSSNYSATDQSPFQRLLPGDSSAPSRRVAIAHYLFGSGSSRVFLLNALWIAALFLLVHFLGTNNRGKPGQLLFMLPFLVFLFIAAGYTTARRMRPLWLRAGLSRAGLFSLAERQGLAASLTTWSLIALMAGTLTVLRDPSRAADALMFVGAQLVVGVAGFYAGLATVKPWNFGEMAMVVVLGVLFVAQVGVGQDGWRDGYVPTGTGYTALIAGVLAIALRLLAAWRWRALDWRLVAAVKPLAWRS